MKSHAHARARAHQKNQVVVFNMQMYAYPPSAYAPRPVGASSAAAPASSKWSVGGVIGGLLVNAIVSGVVFWLTYLFIVNSSNPDATYQKYLESNLGVVMELVTMYMELHDTWLGPFLLVLPVLVTSVGAAANLRFVWTVALTALLSAAGTTAIMNDATHGKRHPSHSSEQDRKKD